MTTNEFAEGGYTGAASPRLVLRPRAASTVDSRANALREAFAVLTEYMDAPDVVDAIALATYIELGVDPYTKAARE